MILTAVEKAARLQRPAGLRHGVEFEYGGKRTGDWDVLDCDPGDADSGGDLAKSFEGAWVIDGAVGSEAEIVVNVAREGTPGGQAFNRTLLRRKGR